MSNVPVIQAVKAAEAFRKLHWRRAAGILGVVALGATLSEAGALSGQAEILSAGRLIYVVSAILAYAALMRLAFIDEHPGDPEFVPGPHGFQFGRPELRLLGVGGLMLFIVILAAALAIFMIMLVLVTAGIGAITADTSPETIMEALGPGGQGSLSLVVLLVLGALMFLSVRLSLAGPATLSRRKVAVFETWHLTRGQFWRILAATILVGLPALAAGVVVGLGLNLVGGPVGPNGTPQVSLAAALALGALQGGVAAFIVLPLSVGLSAFLYRGLRDRPDVQAPSDR
jgi:hypothetical protein